jgi:hypothetical protein
MTRTASFLLGPLASIALCASASATGAQSAGRGELPITVGPNVQVSSARPRLPHYEHLAGAHAKDSNRMMACSMAYDPDRGRVVSILYTTVDGGKSWRETLYSDRDSRTTGDPVCVYGAADTALFVVLSVQPRGMHNYRSTDAGLTWTQTSDMPFIDRENLVVDQTGGKYNGRVYLNGTGASPGIDSGSDAAVVLFRSLDGGKTFAGPASRTAFAPRSINGMGPSVVLSDGSVVAVFGEERTRGARDEDNRRGAIAQLRSVISRDGGETLDGGGVVGDWYMARTRSQGSHIPWLAVDPGSPPYKDRLYAVWDDFREGRLTVLLAWSSDKGKTWSKPVHVVDDRPSMNADEGPDNINPLVAVNKEGVVGVAWYDRRDHKDDLGWDIRFAASTDGGQSFSPSVKVSSAPNRYGGGELWPTEGSASGGGTRTNPDAPPAKTPLTLAITVNQFFYSSGHTSGLLVTADGVFHPLWEDNRTGVSQLWTAPVSVRAAAVQHGALELASMTDVTDRVTANLTQTSYDRATGTITAQLRLRNTSRETISGPVKARVIALNSDLGVAQLLGSDNGTNGAGAILDLSSLLSGGTLLPDSTSASRTVRIHLTDLRPFKQGDRLVFGLAALDVRVYAASVKGAGGSSRPAP